MKVELLDHVARFRSFDEQERTLLAGVMHEQRCAPEAVVFRKGDRASKCYLVLAGEIDVRIDGPDGITHTVATLSVGDIFGEIALVDGGLRSATCVVGERGAILATLGRAEFDQIFRAGSRFAYTLVDLIGEQVVDRLRSAAGRLLEVVLAERKTSSVDRPGLA